MAKDKYPECEKMRSVSDESHSIGEFLDWLSEQGIMLCRWKESESKPFYYPAHYWTIPDSPEKLLATYFKIDLKKVEEEKMLILSEIKK